MKKETIKVTINPDGVSCTEVMNLTAPRRKERPGDRIRELNDLMNMKPLRTFEIELPPLLIKDKYGNLSHPKIELPKPGTTHTAEITEEYPEPVNGIAGKVKIIS